MAIPCTDCLSWPVSCPINILLDGCSIYQFPFSDQLAAPTINYLPIFALTTDLVGCPNNYLLANNVLWLTDWLPSGGCPINKFPFTDWLAALTINYLLIIWHDYQLAALTIILNVIPEEGFSKDVCRGPISINPLEDKMENDDGLGVDLGSRQQLESALDDDRFVMNRHERRGGDCTLSSPCPVVQTL